VALGVLVIAVTASAQVVKAPGGLKDRVAKAAKLKPEDVEKMLKELGPAIRAELTAGKQVELPGVGVFRVVRIAEHKDLVGGRVTRVPATNVVEFVSGAELTNAANAPGAIPARTVPAFEYIPRPGETPGLKTEGLKTGRTRTR